MGQILNNVSMYIEQNGLISGIIRGSISYNLVGSRYKGSGTELIVPKELKEIYEDSSIFNIIIKNKEILILKDIVLLPKPHEVYITKSLAVIRNFEFQTF